MLPITDTELLAVKKPAQYLGGEHNAVIKNDADVDLHFALAFPDTYEVGMSHLGMQLLYEIINRDPKAWAERAFMPLRDMEEILRKYQFPLTSLESKRPLNRFDLVGFSLQYELCLTNILAMLDLSAIPLCAIDRVDTDPLIIGGGPFTYHPEPVATFFDLFLLGDAEEAMAELLAVARKTKGLPREKRLEEFSEIEGVYVPSFYEPRFHPDGQFSGVRPKGNAKPVVLRRLLATMENAPYVENPIVPNIKTIHNRLNVEVMRGCVRGCRFCQAGYLYRPQRERPPSEILKIVEESLPKTGFEELSLLSLSTADYCSIVPLLKSLMDRYGENDQLAISFPSTRVDALTPEVLEQVQRVRRTNFTVAPEAGTQRLRDVINKGVSDEQILETAANVFRMGWSGIKLYFMIGLPTETDADLEGIVSIAQRVKALPEARGKDITVSVSTLVPKPHTPFQWAEQIAPAEILRRQRFLAFALRKARVNFRYHDAFSTLLEGVFARGGRELAPAICRAYELGCRLDAWTEEVSEEKWMLAFQETGIDPYSYLQERPLDAPLPWDHLSCGIPKGYFLKEYKRALRDHVTPDCLTTSCSVCGVCDYDMSHNVLWPRQETDQIAFTQHSTEERKKGPRDLPPPSVRRRIRYEKRGAMRFLGHLELANLFHRACRRAEIPLAYSKGFHPFPKIAFGPPLQLGIESGEEWADMLLTEEMPCSDLAAALNGALPEGLHVTAVSNISLKNPALQSRVYAQRYRVQWIAEPSGVFTDGCGDLAASILSHVVIRPGTKQSRLEQRFTLRNEIIDLELGSDEFSFTLLFDVKRAQPRPLEIVKSLSGLDVGSYRIEKTETFFRADELREHESWHVTL